MTVEEMRGKSVEELREELLTLKKEQFNLRFQAAGSTLENTSRVRVVRRDVARVLTILNEKAGAAVRTDSATAA